MGRVTRPSDRAAVAGVIDPDAYAANTYTTDWIDMSTWERLLGIIQWGDMGAGGTVNAKFQQASDSSGTGAKDITGAAITAVDQDSSPNQDNQQALINLRGEQLDVTNSFTHVRLSVTIGTAAIDMSAIVLGFDARYAPGADSDLSSVAEIIS